jgi:hypothetical protein
MVDWYVLQQSLFEVLLILIISAPIAWFFHGWAMAVVDVMVPDD